MPLKGSNPQADWNRLKPDTIHAVRQLLSQLEHSESSQDLLDSYLYAKRLLAQSLQAYIRITMADELTTLQELRARLGHEMKRRYGDRIPEEYLIVPYGSRTHEELFTLLLQQQGRPVEAAFLRIITADSVHTERRTRELRELGLDIETTKSGGSDVYTLKSLEIDTNMIPTIISNTIKRKKPPTRERRALHAILGIEDRA
ncbi:hypothetical protein [Streptomyces cylindrosporus]|uniref:Uncharacterized protein n=1 Tax=Streptomyces cylindrosporus TaxID=2927583 RepID=A0ABS9YH10_9ACTN|nr:hypothetical protein [Streptomyces cylindrosporus]MCI3276480.1 hypothetical protein [Streptomyces cylindrosporus]